MPQLLYPQERSIWYPLDGGWVGLGASLNVVAENNPCLCQELSPIFIMHPRHYID
jgi:hypothetical protein